MRMIAGVRASAAAGQVGVGSLSLPHCDVGRLVGRLGLAQGEAT
jgi:hypothetical protein